MTSRLALHRALRAAGLMAALAAAGCGGGGGGGDAPPPVTQVTITAANQEIVATTTANVFVGFGGSAAVIAAKDGPEALKAQAAVVPTAGALLVGSARRALLTR